MVMEKEGRCWKGRITARVKEKRKDKRRKGRMETQPPTPRPSLYDGIFCRPFQLPPTAFNHRQTPLYHLHRSRKSTTKHQSFAKSRRGKNRKRLKAPGCFYADTFFDGGGKERSLPNAETINIKFSSFVAFPIFLSVFRCSSVRPTPWYIRRFVK